MALINIKKKKKFSLDERRSCSICNEKFNFNEYKNIYIYLSSLKNPVENFFNIIKNKGEFKFIPGVNMTKMWKKSSNKVFCPSCLMDFKNAYNLNRTCLKCGKKITFLECCWSSLNKQFLKEELMVYWINPLIQFYCCSCYKQQKLMAE